MSENESAHWSAYKSVSQHVRAERRRNAADQYGACQAKAELLGMTLRRCSESHYKLTVGKRVWNVYPGNCRLIGVRDTGTMFVQLKDDWTIADVIDAVDRTLKTWKDAKEHALRIGKPSVATSEETNSGLEEA